MATRDLHRRLLSRSGGDKHVARQDSRPFLRLCCSRDIRSGSLDGTSILSGARTLRLPDNRGGAVALLPTGFSGGVLSPGRGVVANGTEPASRRGLGVGGLG